jgi:hypothetical protein
MSKSRNFVAGVSLATAVFTGVSAGIDSQAQHAEAAVSASHNKFSNETPKVRSLSRQIIQHAIPTIGMANGPVTYSATNKEGETISFLTYSPKGVLNSKSVDEVAIRATYASGNTLQLGLFKSPKTGRWTADCADTLPWDYATASEVDQSSVLAPSGAYVKSTPAAERMLNETIRESNLFIEHLGNTPAGEPLKGHTFNVSAFTCKALYSAATA